MLASGFNPERSIMTALFVVPVLNTVTVSQTAIRTLRTPAKVVFEPLDHVDSIRILYFDPLIDSET